MKHQTLTGLIADGAMISVSKTDGRWTATAVPCSSEVRVKPLTVERTTLPDALCALGELMDAEHTRWDAIARQQACA